MSYAIKASKANINAITETALDNLSYHSDYNTLKYHLSGTTNLTINYSQYYGSVVDGNGTHYLHIVHGTVAHNLGYVPFFTAFTRTSPGTTGTVWNMAPYLEGGVSSFVRFETFADTNNLYFQAHMQNDLNTGSDIETFQYKVFRNNTGL